jgi:hypothetical protein
VDYSAPSRHASTEPLRAFSSAVTPGAKAPTSTPRKVWRVWRARRLQTLVPPERPRGDVESAPMPKRPTPWEYFLRSQITAPECDGSHATLSRW